MSSKKEIAFSGRRLLSFDLFRGIAVVLLVTLALSYWLIDIRKFNSCLSPFVVVSMSAIFIYLFFYTIDKQWDFTAVFTNGVLSWTNISEFIVNLFASLSILALEWLLCYLYRKKYSLKYKSIKLKIECYEKYIPQKLYQNNCCCHIRCNVGIACICRFRS